MLEAYYYSNSCAIQNFIQLSFCYSFARLNRLRAARVMFSICAQSLELNLVKSREAQLISFLEFFAIILNEILEIF